MPPPFSGTYKAMKRVAGAAVRKAVPLRAWSCLAGAPPLVPLYHLVSDAQVAHVRHLYRYRNVREFEHELEFLLRHFEPVGLDGATPLVTRRPGFGRPSFHLTFDDGLREVHEIVAPLLHRKGVPATFFLATAFLDGRGMAHDNKISVLLERMAGGISGAVRREIENALGPTDQPADLASRMRAIPHAAHQKVDQIAGILDFDLPHYVTLNQPHLTSPQIEALVKQGFTVGAHSCCHPLYREIPLTEQLAETEASMDQVVSRFGAKTRAFAFPYNDEGVTPEFFDRIFATGKVDLTFGTNGLTPHFHARNVERVVMERSAPDVGALVAAEYVQAARLRFRLG